MKETNKRIIYWDIIKLFAIFCVIYGHIIQNLNPEERSLWESNIENLIISFHMPLFMIVSGYFARSLFKNRITDVFNQKLVQLYVPSITTYFLTGVVLIFLRQTPLGSGFKSLLEYCLVSYWFLKALFIFYIITSFLILLWDKKKILFVITLISFLLLPTNLLDTVHCISMYPYFLLGLLLWKYENILFNNKRAIVIVSLVVFALLSYFYSPSEYNMYDHLFSWEKEYLLLYIVRFIIGVSASLVCILIIREICLYIGENKFVIYLAKLGTCTLGIYVFQQNFMVFGKYYCKEIVQRINPFRDTVYEFIYFDYIFCFILAIIITLICAYMVIVLRKTKYLRLILLGEK